jgi:hypothetical protein
MQCALALGGNSPSSSSSSSSSGSTISDDIAEHDICIRYNY